MPGRVTNFFRSHSDSFVHAADSKKSTRRSTSSKRTTSSSERSSTSSISSLNSDYSNPKMPDHKRLSLTGLHSAKSSSIKIGQPNIDITIESPPLVFYGSAVASTGALLSGQVMVNVADDPLVTENFKMRLVVQTTRKKPFHAHCTDCAQQTEELMRWDFLQGQATLKKGEHDYPFSFLFPGHLPASMNSNLVKIEYLLKATITPKSGEPIKLSKSLHVQRAIQPSDAPKKSIRIFPPTNLTANCTLPPVVHPIGEFNLTMRMDGVVKRNEDAKSQTQWRMKRMTWRLDEIQKEISPACPKHLAKLGLTGEDAENVQKKGVAHEHVRTLNTDEIKSGWKADYSALDGGQIDMEFPFSIKPDAQPICDMKSADGTEVSHVLIVEMIVAEEFAPIAKPNQITPTGAARVLRMHFTVILTERSGMGISWDEEQPPLYENVPDSPPIYGKTDELPLYDELAPLDRAGSPGLTAPPPAHLPSGSRSSR
ncbi:LMBR1 domain-containing protein [Phlyctema vagabunda]|uniref:LMBR1 domain-containing protein n=1 Tax=Phlyctema vagabunda TaxID=108571 RepID=A0ABR4PJ43_9HELO